MATNIRLDENKEGLVSIGPASYHPNSQKQRNSSMKVDDLKKQPLAFEILKCTSPDSQSKRGPKCQLKFGNGLP
jgi:hypothetical protein